MISPVVRIRREVPDHIQIDTMELLVPLPKGKVDRRHVKTHTLLSWVKSKRLKAPEFDSQTLKGSLVKSDGVYYRFVDVLSKVGSDKLNDWFKNLVRNPDHDMNAVDLG